LTEYSVVSRVDGIAPEANALDSAAASSLAITQSSPDSNATHVAANGTILTAVSVDEYVASSRESTQIAIRGSLFSRQMTPIHTVNARTSFDFTEGYTRCLSGERCGMLNRWGCRIGLATVKAI
jgi:hypothetical protein